MSVFRLKDSKSRSLPWRAVVSRRGQKRLMKQFATRAEAEMWESEHKKQERMKEIPEYQQMEQYKLLVQHTVKDLIEYYITNNRHLSKNELVTLHAFLRDDICGKNLMELSDVDVNWFVEKRKPETWKGKPLTPRTIRRQLNLVQRVFSWSKEFRKGFKPLPNPFRGIRIKGSTGGTRDRALEGDELARILIACRRCLGQNKTFVPLAIMLAIDTAMRRQEIFNLTWNDIDEKNRRITIRKSKTDAVMGRTKGTTIVLPIMAMHLLKTLPRKNGNDRIFSMTETAFSQAWKKVLKYARVSNLHFHDLRREASDRFIRAGLTIEQRNMMRRHADKSMDSTYTSRNFLLNEIQEKLDTFVREHWKELFSLWPREAF